MPLLPVRFKVRWLLVVASILTILAGVAWTKKNG